MDRGWLPVALVALAVLAGCLGLGEDDAPETTRTTGIPEVTAESSAIAGTVADTAVQPIGNATVTVLEVGQNTTTAPDGSFAIGGLHPGTYTVTVRADGFLPTQREVQAPAGEAASVDFLLTHAQETQPFTQQFELNGFMEYGWGAGVNLTGDARAVRDTNCDYDEIAGPNCRGEFDLQPPLDALVFEMTWEASTGLGDEMLVMMRVQDNASVITGEWEIFTVEGASPLRYTMDRAELDNVSAEFSQRCEDGEDQFCGLNFRDRGWPMQTRVWPGWRCPTGTAGFCPVVQQDYTQYVTAFYHQPAPEGYSLLDG